MSNRYYRFRAAAKCAECGAAPNGVYCTGCQAYHRQRVAVTRTENRAAYNAYMREWKAKRRLLEVNLG